MESNITINDHVFTLKTKDTSYVFHVLPSGHLEHLYYGEKVDFGGTYGGIIPKWEFLEGNTIAYNESTFANIGLENRCLEMSSVGKGDVREAFVELIYHNGSRTCDFLYEKHEVRKKQGLDTLPSSYDEMGQVETLVVTLVDTTYDVRLELLYSVFYETNVIVRSSRLINESAHDVTVERLLSGQIDLEEGRFTLHTFQGAWAREMERVSIPCTGGIVVNDSKTGTSSNRRNPFMILAEEGTTEEYGACYGCNLIYSGNHYEAVEVGSFHTTRFLTGINPWGFSYSLAAGEILEAPEAVYTYSDKGFGGVSLAMHAFVREHVVRGVWKYKERPILLNSWEAAYFKFNESKLLKLAKKAQTVGVELFVLDDGWFGERNDDTSSLGDWQVNRKKLPNGLKGLAKKINKMGLSFGIWVEPEMVNRNSECYRKHPEYAVEIPGQEQSLGRHQLLLDLTNEEVQDYIIEQMTHVFESANISYVKWDMNRIVSDAYSKFLGASNQGMFYHKYIIGLYRVLDVLTSRFPEILFESCASGGNRFDLGMLTYMPQIWASDNTDAICRASIQTGYSYGYPMSTVGAHVSACPNHQTLRVTSLDTRFQVACFGLLGYEYNFMDMNKDELGKIKEQIVWYKTYRKTLQYGQYYRLKNGEEGAYQWMVVDENKECAIGFHLQKESKANDTKHSFKTKGLDEKKLYHFTNRRLDFDIREFGNLINYVSPIDIKQDGMMHQIIAKFVKMHSEKEDYLIAGSAANKVGVRLSQMFGCSGYNDQVAHFPDFSSRIYVMEEVEKKEI